jgi:hypothetical protein
MFYSLGCHIQTDFFAKSALIKRILIKRRYFDVKGEDAKRLLIVYMMKIGKPLSDGVVESSEWPVRHERVR